MQFNNGQHNKARKMHLLSFWMMYSIAILNKQNKVFEIYILIYFRQGNFK